MTDYTKLAEDALNLPWGGERPHYHDLARALLACDRERQEEIERRMQTWESMNNEVQKAEALAQTYRDALVFYAQQRGLGARLASDGGKIARAALAAGDKTPEMSVPCQEPERSGLVDGEAAGDKT